MLNSKRTTPISLVNEPCLISVQGFASPDLSLFPSRCAKKPAAAVSTTSLLFVFCFLIILSLFSVLNHAADPPQPNQLATGKILPQTAIPTPRLPKAPKHYPAHPTYSWLDQPSPFACPVISSRSLKISRFIFISSTEPQIFLIREGELLLGRDLDLWIFRSQRCRVWQLSPSLFRCELIVIAELRTLKLPGQ